MAPPSSEMPYAMSTHGSRNTLIYALLRQRIVLKHVVPRTQVADVRIPREWRYACACSLRRRRSFSRSINFDTSKCIVLVLGDADSQVEVVTRAHSFSSTPGMRNGRLQKFSNRHRDIPRVRNGGRRIETLSIAIQDGAREDLLGICQLDVDNDLLFRGTAHPNVFIRALKRIGELTYLVPEWRIGSGVIKLSKLHSSERLFWRGE